MIPGANLLGLAFRAIRPQKIPWRAFTGRTENAAGDTVATFAPAVELTGAMYPLDTKLYQQFGLNLAKNYARLYIFGSAQPTARDRDGDLILFGGKTWQCEDAWDWSDVGEYRRILCVEVPPYE